MLGFGRKKLTPGAVAPVADNVLFKIPRTTFIWLLAAVGAVILPHLTRMPVWLSAMCVLCMLGRFLIYQGKLSFPGNFIKFCLVSFMAFMVILRYGRDIFSTDATVGVLLTGITLKLLEMQRKRDVLLVIYLSYFTVIAEFIYSQSIPIAVYMAFAVLIITSALMSLHQREDAQRGLRTMKMSGAILLQSIPLMLALFVLFPRISPLWAVPLQTSKARTGLSENMAPGDIGKLARSAELAFRVEFDGDLPPYEELYWRGITLDEFNGKEWRRGFPVEAQSLNPASLVRRSWFESIEYTGRRTAYSVILEPTYQNWIFTLQMPVINDERMAMLREYQVETRRRVSQRFSYDASSYLDFATGSTLDPVIARRAVMLPAEGNSRAYEFAQQLRETNTTDAAYLSAVLDYFRTQPFYYTLEPATLGANPVDQFLFDTREGFCEHYASAFTYLMRAAGIPARVVTGYMGGEINPYDDTLTVRQYDAHAWSEVWLADKGWIRVDPTAAVAPERVSQGSDAALQQEENFLQDQGFSLMRFRNSLLLNDLRLRLEMIDYAWNRFILNYDQDMQFRFFSAIFGTVTRLKIMLTVIGFMLLTTVFIALLLFRKSSRAQLAPATRLYLKFCQQLAKRGYSRHCGETPQQFMERVSAQQPQWHTALADITTLFLELAYQSHTQDDARLKTLQQQIRRFRLLA